MTTIAPEQVNPLTLPSVPLDCRKSLPECPGIYFAIDGTGTVQYIGRSNNIRQRWINHHRYSQLEALENIQIGWLQVSDSLLLPSIEAALIEYFQPLLNNNFSVPGSIPCDETRVCIRISPLRKEALRKKAESEGRTVTNVIMGLIDAYLGVTQESREILELKLRISDLEEKVFGKLT